MKTKKQTVLITGATSGIGYEFAHIFAEKGYDLFLASRDRERLASIQTRFGDLYGIAVTTMPVDLAKPGVARKVYEETIRQKIDIQVLVNNAGFGIAGEHVDLDRLRVEEMIQLNVTSLTEMCSLFGAEMKKRKSGHILNVASTAAYQPVPYIAAYGATKSYVLNFSEALAMEMEDYGVSVTCLSPGPTDTKFFDSVGIEGLAEKKTGIWAKNNRMESRQVAQIGVEALFAGKMSLVAGNWNSLFAFSSRLAPRKATAGISKRIMKQATREERS
ncbi:MAG: SDR family oxidoreductase [Smithellaceae bacterium]